MVRTRRPTPPPPPPSPHGEQGGYPLREHRGMEGEGRQQQKRVTEELSDCEITCGCLASIGAAGGGSGQPLEMKLGKDRKDFLKSHKF